MWDRWEPSMTDEMRSFVAVTIDTAVKLLLASWVKEARRAFPNYRFGAPENLHVTLQFLGDVDRDREPALTAALCSAVEDVPAFRMSLGRAGSFPERGAPRILHVVVDQGREDLLRLADRVRAALSAEGFDPDKAFVPHITLGRSRDRVAPGPGPGGRDIAAQWRDFFASFAASGGSGDRGSSVAWDVSRVLLMESILGPGGPTYTLRGIAPLRGRHRA